MRLVSNSIGKVLRIFLWTTIIIGGIALINTYFYTFHQNIYESILPFDQFITLFFNGISFILIVLYLIWIYKVHLDLNHFYIKYPISPSGALLRILIPIYNIWGMWNIYSTMARQFETRHVTKELANQLSRYIPYYFVLYFISRFVMEILIGSASETIIGVIWLIASVVELVLPVFYLLIVQTVTKALQIISGTNEIEEKEAL
ncbi:hypothetical protein [Halalkalibacter urbisdiaboli]|uniref:hypothetical protein n=1 Tax=Halalkalibacter urbisdiaboli TaxID=1960589 RepID=UPI0013FDDEEF|nr:hypothetical protein [Halalkalibacter urbisdiaboli]